MHLLFTYLGLRVHSEVCTSDGRADCVVETDSRVYILEFKLDESAESALAQIRQKKTLPSLVEQGQAGNRLRRQFFQRNTKHRGVEGRGNALTPAQEPARSVATPNARSIRIRHTK